MFLCQIDRKIHLKIPFSYESNGKCFFAKCDEILFYFNQLYYYFLIGTLKFEVLQNQKVFIFEKFVSNNLDYLFDQ